MHLTSFAALALSTLACVQLASCAREEQDEAHMIFQTDDAYHASHLHLSGYFPQRIFSEYKERSQFKDKWYSSYLAKMGEPSMLELAADTNAFAYRFTWLREYHYPVCTRVDIKPDGSAMLSLKTLTGDSMYEPGTLWTNMTAVVASNGVARLLHKIEYCNFWRQKTVLGGHEGRDGAQWIIEGVSNGVYHITDRWCPDQVAYKDAALEFLALAGFAVEPVY